MLMEVIMEHPIYFFLPILMIVVGVYLLFLHKRRCLLCGRSVRPFWRECSCASEPPTVFYQEPEEEQEDGFLDDMSMRPLSEDQKPDDMRPLSDDQKPEEKPEIGPRAEVKPFSYDDAQPLSGEGTGTEVMLPSIAQAWLLIEEGENPQKRYEIRKNVISVGTSSDNDIVLTDKAVSRHHAKIRIERDKYFIYDLASTNGTRVNDRKITKKWIKEGDRIELGHTRMAFKTEALPSEISDYRHKPSDLLKI